MDNYFLNINASNNDERFVLNVEKDNYSISVFYYVYKNDVLTKEETFTIAGGASGCINEKDINAITNIFSKLYKNDLIIKKLNEISNEKKSIQLVKTKKIKK